jgi:P pilus assembly chaperone PapD
MRLLTAFFFAFIMMGSTASFAQVSISPTTIFIGNNNFGSFMVTNNSNQAQEIAVEFTFGYTVSDSMGNITMLFSDSTALAEQKSISEYVRSFPRSFTLAPGQRQTVRLTVRPPGTLDDGTYWTRVKVRSTPQSAVIQQTEVGGVGTQISFIFEQVLGVYYTKGAFRTAVVPSNVTFAKTETNTLLVYDVALTANSPFLGTIDAVVKDASGRTVFEEQQTTTIFESGKRNFQLPLEAITSGNYTVTLSFSTNRRDIPSAEQIPMESVTQTFQVRF